MINTIVFTIYILISTALFVSTISCYMHWLKYHPSAHNMCLVKYYIAFTTFLYVLMLCITYCGYIICSA